MIDTLVVSFYQFVGIDNIDGLVASIKEKCLQEQVKGSIILSNEGLNGTISGPNEHCIEYMKHVHSDERFVNLEFKIDDPSNPENCFSNSGLYLEKQYIFLGFTFFVNSYHLKFNKNAKPYLHIFGHGESF